MKFVEYVRDSMPLWILVLFMAGIVSANNHWKREAIGKGFAEYCEDGEWAWKGECE